LLTSFEQQQQASLDMLRQREALIAKWYWHCLSTVLKDTLPFARRSLQGATDEFNASINYGYGILYNIVETAIVAAGLDSSLGLMHAMGYGKLSLVYDLIEPYRPWVDELIVQLILRGLLQKNNFETDGKLMSLNKAGKAILIEALVSKLNSKIYYEGKRIKRKDQIFFDTRKLAQFLLKDYKHV
jgi:CRISP-associated protein Cas1